MKRGAFILFEGVDRCGKTTQCHRLAASLIAKGLSVFQIRFPDRTTGIGKMIDSYLKSDVDLDDHAIHLLFSANRWELSGKINQALKDGHIVIADRYAFSGVAFTGAKVGMSLSWCKASDSGLPAPDVVMYMDLPYEKAALRGAFGEERYEVKEMQLKVRENFNELRSSCASSTWHVIDADNTVEALASSIEELALKHIDLAASKPVGVLWPEYSIASE